MVTEDIINLLINEINTVGLYTGDIIGFDIDMWRIIENKRNCFFVYKNADKTHRCGLLVLNATILSVIYFDCFGGIFTYRYDISDINIKSIIELFPERRCLNNI